MFVITRIFAHARTGDRRVAGENASEVIASRAKKKTFNMVMVVALLQGDRLGQS